jgi:malate dehydrogenase (oxaloacetate-decarboxylating)(NADP+)
MSQDLTQAALAYHKNPKPGKLTVNASKPVATQQDLSLAYSPGVAAACTAIAKDPTAVNAYTIRQNLVGVITNGSAVLGLGDIGPLASKPVMEGKAVLFKKFAGIDVFDLELDAKDPETFVNCVAALEPTFGGINLEDIKAPECFVIEEALKKRLNIPVFHDDQHGTAIIVAAALTNALFLTGKNLNSIKLVTSGAGAAAIACLNLLIKMGLDPKNVTLTDIDGVIHGDRGDVDKYRAPYAHHTSNRTLAQAIEGADVFLGLSAGGVLKPEMVNTMTKSQPIIFALANPTPEIMPDVVKDMRPDALMATGRSDFPNQVNNVLCFPFLFRGALDVGATTINHQMMIACVNALADLSRAEESDIVRAAYGEACTSFGPNCLIPKPFDPRLILCLAPAVAQAAMDSGVATSPIDNMEAYKKDLENHVYSSGLLMRPIFDRAIAQPKRLVFAEGEDRRILQAVQEVLDQKIAHPILIGRPAVIKDRVSQLGLRFNPDKDIEIVNPEYDPRFKVYWQLYHKLMARDGVSPEQAKYLVRTQPTVIGALMMHRGEADALLCGRLNRYGPHLYHIKTIVGLKEGLSKPAAVSVAITDQGVYFMGDTHITQDPTPDEIASITCLIADVVKWFDLDPKIALLSHSDFGSSPHPSAQKMRKALTKIRQLNPDLVVDGEMKASTALNACYRTAICPDTPLTGEANVLIMPSLDAAHIAFELLQGTQSGLGVGPILVGPKAPVHILTPAHTVRGIVNMAALAVVQAQDHKR